MSSTNAIVPLTAQDLLQTPSLFETYKTLANIIATSQLSYGKATTAEETAKKQRDIFLLILKGLELGMMPMQALDSIDVISGKPAIKPQGMLALIKSKHLLEWMKVEDDGQTCTVTMKRKDETEPYVESFGMADADAMMTTEWVSGVKQTISLSQKHNWRSQPKTMRKWRAISACCRTAFPDVVQGMYTAEEMGADVNLTEDGEMIVIERPEPQALSTPATNIVGFQPETQPEEPTTDSTPIITGEQAREALNQSSKPNRIGDTPSGGTKLGKKDEPESYPAAGPSGEMVDWAKPDTIASLVKAVESRIPGIQPREIVKFAGVQGMDVYVDWNAKHTSGKAAVTAILAAFEATQTPATTKSKWTADEVALLEQWIKAKFDLKPEHVMSSMGITSWSESCIDIFQAQGSIVAHALSKEWVLIADSAVYDGKRITFKAVVDVVEFSRKTIAGMVGEGYAAAHGITTWAASKKPYPLTPPVAIVWKKNEGDNGTYYTVEDAKPLGDEQQTPDAEVSFADEPEAVPQ